MLSHHTVSMELFPKSSFLLIILLLSHQRWRVNATDCCYLPFDRRQTATKKTNETRKEEKERGEAGGDGHRRRCRKIDIGANKINKISIGFHSHSVDIMLSRAACDAVVTTNACKQ